MENSQIVYFKKDFSIDFKLCYFYNEKKNKIKKEMSKMPKNKYIDIYKDIKMKIEQNEYAYQQLLPSENLLIQQYNCSRNTVRRAVSHLVMDGYVQTIQGKGVRNIYIPMKQSTFTLGEIESFRESALRNGQTPHTEILLFTEKIVDELLSEKTTFSIGSEVYYIQRLHYLDGIPLILNHNYFLKECVSGLTKQIAETSIYQYLEQTLHMTIVNSRRIMTIEKANDLDKKYLNLKEHDYNCMAVVSSYTYNSDGIMFEFTQSRHLPNYFRFQDNAVRKPI